MTAPEPRLAVVSGGGTGIGRAIAEALLRAGDEVLLVGRRAEVLEATVAELGAGTGRGDAVGYVVADVADPAGLERVQGAVAERGGRVDVVVANAGHPAPKTGTGLAEIAAAWQDTFRANVLTAVLLVEALAPGLARPGGRIVLISSASAVQGNASPAYGAAKAALHGWVLNLANQLGPDGVTANVVAPGFTDGTELVAGRIPPERRARLLERIAAGRPAEPAEIAAVVAMVAAREASYLNGQVICVDGGHRST